MVVIAIIAVLAGLIFPTISKARDKAKLLKCSSNLHQIGIAIRGYCTDNGRWPLGYADAGSGLPWPEQGEWSYFLNEYLGGPRLTWASYSDSGNRRSRVIVCPSVNMVGFYATYSSHPGIMVDPGWGSALRYPVDGLPYHPVFNRPQDLCVMIDGMPWVAPDGGHGVNATYFRVDPYATEDASSTDASNAETPIAMPFAAHNEAGLAPGVSAGWPHWRHDGAMNTLRCDGHTETLKLVGAGGLCEFKEKHVKYGY